MSANTKLVPLALAITLAGCWDDNKDDFSGYKANISRTTHGTAHIVASDYASLGFGQGYAYSEDRFCTLMDQIVKVRGERAKYFGPGDNSEHLTTDLAYKALQMVEKAPGHLASLTADARDMMEGYAAGVNRYLADTGADNLPGSCAGAEWVDNISATDLMAYYLDIATLAGIRNFIPAIANAQPPAAAPALALQAQANTTISKDHASNAIAVGKQLAAKDGGVLLSNTHLPWEGELRYHEVQLTIPDELNVAGVSLGGAIGVQIGFNDSMAWTHTTSPSNQFLVYQLKLDPADPTRYVLNGVSTPMDSVEVSVEVKGMDQPVVQSYYSTRFGPVLEADPMGLAWNSQNAFAILDMNVDNGGFIGTFLEMAKADSVDALQQVFERLGGVPWNHTMATDTSGQVLYADTTFVPDLNSLVEAGYFDIVNNPDPMSLAEMTIAGAYQQGLVLMDGSTTLALPKSKDDQRVKTAIAFSDAPQVKRDDYVMNANDSYWLPNPEAPFNGKFSGFYGDQGDVPRSFRTRMGLTQIEELVPNSVSGETLQNLLFANRSFTAELWQDTLCNGAAASVKNSADEDVNISAACNIVANTWDGKLNLDSQGAHLFRETLSAVKGISDAGQVENIDVFTTAYDKNTPLTTPSGLSAAGQDLFLKHMADAVGRLDGLNIALDAELQDVQFTLKGDEKIAVHGGLQKIDGAFNKVEYRRDANMYTTLETPMARAAVVNDNTNLTEEGYLINYGASYVLTVDFSEGKPAAEALLVYSQSNHTDSEFFSDQTKAYRDKAWRAVPFSIEDVKAATISNKTVKQSL